MIHALFYSAAAAGWLVFIWAALWPDSGQHVRPRREQREEGRKEVLADLDALARITWLYATLRLRPAAVRPVAEEESPAPVPPLPGRDPSPEPRGCCFTLEGDPHAFPCASAAIPAAGWHPYQLDRETSVDLPVIDGDVPVVPRFMQAEVAGQ
jgi:hypothetical protein